MTSHGAPETSGIGRESAVPTVRVLRNDEELREAVQRAREFERRGLEEFRHRLGSYDRFLDEPRTDGEERSWHPSTNRIAEVVAIDSSIEVGES